MRQLAVVAVVAVLRSAAALDNGLAQTPPMGFRTWNQVSTYISIIIYNTHICSPV